MNVLYVTISSLHLFGGEAAYYAQQLEKMCNPYTPEIVVVLVAIRGPGDDWVAYLGWPHGNLVAERAMEAMWQPRREPADVAKSGDKISEALARQLFPSIRGCYRN